MRELGSDLLWDPEEAAELLEVVRQLHSAAATDRRRALSKILDSPMLVEHVWQQWQRRHVAELMIDDDRYDQEVVKTAAELARVRETVRSLQDDDNWRVRREAIALTQLLDSTDADPEEGHAAFRLALDHGRSKWTTRVLIEMSVWILGNALMVTLIWWRGLTWWTAAAIGLLILSYSLRLAIKGSSRSVWPRL